MSCQDQRLINRIAMLLTDGREAGLSSVGLTHKLIETFNISEKPLAQTINKWYCASCNRLSTGNELDTCNFCDRPFEEYDEHFG